MRLISSRALMIPVIVFLISLVAVPYASADIVKVQSQQACQFFTLAASPGTSQSGVYCTGSSSAPGAYSLTGILNGTIDLFVGLSTTPSWNIVNDTGSALTSLNLYYSGSLDPTAFIDLQVSGTTLFTTCTTKTANNIVHSSSNCGPAGDTPNNPSLPVLMTWSGGTGVAANAEFNLGTASFAHAGADSGCISGTSNCQPVSTPEPPMLTLLCTGVFALLGFRRGSKLD